MFQYWYVTICMSMIALQSIKQERAKGGNTMISIQGRIAEAFAAAISSAYPNLENASVAVTPSTNEKFGEYQCNSAMAINGVIILRKIYLHQLHLNKTLCNPILWYIEICFLLCCLASESARCQE